METKFCRNYWKGRTRIQGDHRTFAHDDSGLRPPPNFTNTTKCHFWVSNRFKMGEDCPFAHGGGASQHVRCCTSSIKPGQQIGTGIQAFIKSTARGSPNVVSIAASALAPPAKAEPQSSTHCPHCCFPCEIAGARFCARCGGTLVAHTMFDQGSTQPGPSRLQCEKDPDLPAQQRAVETAPCSTSAMPSTTQVSTPAAVPSMSSLHGANISPHVVPPGAVAVVHVLMNCAGLHRQCLRP